MAGKAAVVVMADAAAMEVTVVADKVAAAVMADGAAMAVTQVSWAKMASRAKTGCPANLVSSPTRLLVLCGRRC